MIHDDEDAIYSPVDYYNTNPYLLFLYFLSNLRYLVLTIYPFGTASRALISNWWF